jgi:hypothetical protein
MDNLIEDISPDQIIPKKWDEVVIPSETISTYGVGSSPIGRPFQSTNFKTGQSGWKLDPNGEVELGNGVFRGSINIPNITSPLFSVDVNGNVIANSLRRKDFHWFTLFESLDGYSSSITGGSIVSPATLTTGAINNDVVELTKSILASTASQFSWDKKRSVKALVSFGTDITDQHVFFGIGQLPVSSSLRSLCFHIYGNTIDVESANGTNTSVTGLASTISGNGIYVFEIVFTPGVSAKFYIDNVLVETITTDLPSGATSSGYLFNAYIKTLENVAKSVRFDYWDFWQEN